MSFSKRNNIEANPMPISIRNEAPEQLRIATVTFAYKKLGSYEAIREIICQRLIELPDSNNWSDDPNIKDEVFDLILDCKWNEVYDIIEDVAVKPNIEFQYENASDSNQFTQDMNDFFTSKGYGWLVDEEGRVVYRGDDPFRAAIENTQAELVESGRKNAASEIREALVDISRRPKPDVTGAIQHAMAAVESVARDVTGSKKTLGKLVGELGLPKPMDVAVEKLWGYASNEARHGSESSNPKDVDAELIVSVSCAICSYLVKKSL